MRLPAETDLLLKDLDRVAQIWLDPKHPLHRQTVDALVVSTGMARLIIEQALFNAFSELTLPKLTAFAQSDMKPYLAKTCRKILHILPANVFTAWVPGAVICLLMGDDVWLKPSRREPIFAAAWRSSLELASQQAQRVKIISWDPAILHTVDGVIAYGTDETVSTLRHAMPSGKPFVDYGHRMSIGVVFADALAPDRWRQTRSHLIADASLFKLEGCLSPRIVYVEGALDRRWDDLRAALDPSPDYRTFDNWEGLQREIIRMLPVLSTVGVAGKDPELAISEQRIQSLGVTRVCHLGEMQRPPIFWRNGEIWLPEALS